METQAKTMRGLEFIGKVRANTGKFHKDMVVPGRVSLPAAPEDWPIQLVLGTLNVGIDAHGFPNKLKELGSGDGVKKLDQGNFKPALTIAHDAIAGNTLKPTNDQPLRGTGQVWRAELSVISTGETARCWMLRRIGSGIASQIELVSDNHLRHCMNLSDETVVKITVFEG